ncbi:MAG: dTMP kinase [Candidatus Thermoplasmatota archaeon]
MYGFYTLEGIDGSGKSTISHMLREKLESEGYDVVLTFEPTESWLGEKVNQCIKSGAAPCTTSFVFTADRILHGKKILRWLDQGKIVLCDRYAESTYAYQGVQLEEVMENPVFWLKDLSRGRIPIPDLTFLFLIDPKVALSRIEDRDELIRFEKEKFLKKVHEKYLLVCKGNRFKKIDATLSPRKIVEICYKEIIKTL